MKELEACETVTGNKKTPRNSHWVPYTIQINIFLISPQKTYDKVLLMSTYSIYLHGEIKKQTKTKQKKKTVLLACQELF